MLECTVCVVLTAAKFVIFVWAGRAGSEESPPTRIPATVHRCIRVRDPLPCNTTYVRSAF